MILSKLRWQHLMVLHSYACYVGYSMCRIQKQTQPWAPIVGLDKTQWTFQNYIFRTTNKKKQLLTLPGMMCITNARISMFWYVTPAYILHVPMLRYWYRTVYQFSIWMIAAGYLFNLWFYTFVQIYICAYQKEKQRFHWPFHIVLWIGLLN